MHVAWKKYWQSNMHTSNKYWQSNICTPGKVFKSGTFIKSDQLSSCTLMQPTCIDATSAEKYWQSVAYIYYQQSRCKKYVGNQEHIYKNMHENKHIKLNFKKSENLFLFTWHGLTVLFRLNAGCDVLPHCVLSHFVFLCILPHCILH